jgi:WD40 repeat protein
VNPDSPYKGLVPFEDSGLDALLFFGRERESAIIVENLLAARLTVLYGPSGVGKTSVLRAGVAHRLREQARANVEKRGHPEFAIVVFDGWSDEPTGSLRAAARDELAAQFGSALLDDRAEEPLAETLGRWTHALACDLLLILDQAEEYFLYHQAESGFALELPDLVTQPGLRVRVLLSLRDDALSKLDRFKGRIPNLFSNYLRLDHLDRRSARDAVVRPVERFNELTGDSIDIEPQLVEAVLDQTAAGQVDFGTEGRGLGADEATSGRIEAAYLQLVLERIWEEERATGSDVLRAQTLAELGGAESIVRAHLRRAVQELTSEERDVAADVFRFLVTPSGTKIAHGAGDLAEYASVDEQRLVPVLSTLGRERIVRTVDGAGTNGVRYEIFHDVLGEAVLAWRREQELERERRAAERRHRRLAMVAVLALVALAAMTAVAIYALAQRRDARESAHSARVSAHEAQARELVARSSDMLNEDPLDSVALAARAARLEANPASESALRLALLVSHVRRILRAGAGPVNAAAYDPLSTMVVTADADGTARLFSTASGARLAVLKHDGGVTDASFSPNGKMVATASRDGTVKLWNRKGRLIRTLRHGKPVLDLEFSPKTPFLLTATAAGTVHIWGLKDRSHTVLKTPGPERIAISNDGQYAAVYGADKVARVYGLPTGTHLFDLRHDSKVLGASFGPKKELLATGGANKTARTWDLRRGTPIHTFTGHFGRVVDVAISPLGQFLGTASTDGTARIWDIAVRGGEVASIPTGHKDQLHTIEFSPSGLYVLTSSRDGTARVWKTDRGNEITVLAGHLGDVRGAVFSRTARRVLTYGEDGTARIWDSGTTAELRVLSNEKAPITGLDVADDGHVRLTTDAKGVARVWSRLPGKQPVVLPIRKVRDARLSPSGQSVALATGDRVARIWSTEGVPGLEFRTRDRVDAVAFSPDGRTLATAGPKGVTLSNLQENGRFERLIEAGPGTVDLSFSPDGKRLVTAESDGVGRIWSTGTGKRLQELVGHRDRLTSARFSPDGKLVVTASADHDAIVWDAETGERRRLGLLRGHGAIVSDAGFSSDGRWVVTAGPGRAGLWEVRTGKLLTFLDGHFGPIRASEFGERGFSVFTAGDDGTVRTYMCEVCAPLSDLLTLADQRRASVNESHE